MTAVAKNFRSRFGTRSVSVFERFFQRHAEVLLFERAAELAADRVRHFVGHQVEAGRQAMTGPQGAGDQLQRFGQLRCERLQPPLALEAAATRSAAQPTPTPRAGIRQHAEPGEPDRRCRRRRPGRPQMPKNLPAVSATSACSNKQRRFTNRADELRHRCRWRLASRRPAAPCLMTLSLPALPRAALAARSARRAALRPRRPPCRRAQQCHAANQAGDADEHGDDDPGHGHGE